MLASHQHFVKKEEKRGSAFSKKRGDKEAYNFRPKKTNTHWHNSTINPTKVARYQYRILCLSSNDTFVEKHFVDRTFRRQDISSTNFCRQAFRRQNTSSTGHFVDRAFRRQNILVV